MMTNLSGAVRARIVFGFSALSFIGSSLASAATNNYAPVISGAPASSTVTYGKAYSFKPTASDADRNPLTFSLKNPASWMAFDAKTGAITGTPWVKSTWSNITISVSDGKYTKTLPAFSVTVVAAAAAANKAPTITGAPVVSATYGKAYSFTPKGADAEGNKLTFSIQNKPSWIAFSTTTGALTGTPWIKGAFTWANVIVSVSDGKSTASLPAFNLALGTLTTDGNAMLTWKAPVADENGAVLTDLAGFRVMYGTSPTAMTQKLEVPDASLTSVSIEELSSGTYYFAVKAYMQSGVESSLSEVVYKTII